MKLAWPPRAGRSRHASGYASASDGSSGIELCVAGAAMAEVLAHVEDFTRGEEAGFLVCSASGPERLLAREWHPIGDLEITRRGGEFVLAWDACFNAQMVTRADELGGSLVLVHSHGATPRPRLSADDERSAQALFPGISRLLDGRSCGTVVLGNAAASGRFWRNGVPSGQLGRLKVVGDQVARWLPALRPTATRRTRLDRQTRALGLLSEGSLASARVAVVGCSGGGSHVCQQLGHIGVGTVVPIDDELVEEPNLSRMVGALGADVGRTLKVEAMRRVLEGIDSRIGVEPIRGRVPAPETLEALRSVDIVVACVDTFRAREQINTFCRRHLLPLVDVGLGIETAPDARLVAANGQVIATTPDSSCLRCGPLLSDAVLAAERTARPPGYDRNTAAGDPQVVSMNGVLGSEAVNAVIDMLTGFSRGARGAGWWNYDARRGELAAGPLPPHWSGCPACAEWGHGDPRGD